MATLDTGHVAVLTGLECSDKAIWRGAVRFRVTSILKRKDADWLRMMIAELDGPSIYEQMVAERAAKALAERYQ